MAHLELIVLVTETASPFCATTDRWAVPVFTRPSHTGPYQSVLCVWLSHILFRIWSAKSLDVRLATSCQKQKFFKIVSCLQANKLSSLNSFVSPRLFKLKNWDLCTSFMFINLTAVKYHNIEKFNLHRSAIGLWRKPGTAKW